MSFSFFHLNLINCRDRFTHPLFLRSDPDNTGPPILLHIFILCIGHLTNTYFKKKILLEDDEISNFHIETTYFTTLLYTKTAVVSPLWDVLF